MLSLSRSSTVSQQMKDLPTLSIEVSYPFHSHLIGRSGRNINRIMEDTGTRIHFPDRNRIAGESKSNSVIIRGQLAGLETARQRIRADIPVEFIVDCSLERINSIGQSSLIHYFSTTFGVLLRFYPKIDGVNCQVNIRGHQNRVQHLKESVAYFGRLVHTSIESVVVKMETSFDHVWLVRDHVDKIVAATGAGIRCPDVSIATELPKKYCIWIRGSLDQVYMATSMLNGLLPMQLLVQTESERFNPCFLEEAKTADILLRVERSLSNTMTIRLASYEWNAHNLFDLMRRCLALPYDQRVLPSLPEAWLALAEMTCNNFILSSAKLLSFLSSTTQSSSQQPASAILSDVSELCRSNNSRLSSPRAAIESCIPASLAASRFDENSSRLLSQLLENVGLSHYSNLFVQNEVDLAMFSTLKDEDLISIGISSFGARKIMLNAIRELRK
ncbi:protein bicaudal C homolog 1-like [Daphnia carinata]|uniref:protein bicaudal C homolog 1-like n=1 Tax=Daphnia carinata TaxID=120202 RepID=UPI00257BF9DB|nr:protein bicaudal C homolog 1-like [Daphnia carinata]